MTKLESFSCRIWAFRTHDRIDIFQGTISVSTSEMTLKVIYVQFFIQDGLNFPFMMVSQIDHIRIVKTV